MRTELSLIKSLSEKGMIGMNLNSED